MVLHGGHEGIILKTDRLVYFFMKPKPKQRLLEALDKYVFTQGLSGVGINTILEDADVAKASLYQHFGSKDELIASWLRERQVKWFASFEEYIKNKEHAGRPKEEIIAAFHYLQEWFRIQNFGGCPFVNTFIELKDKNHAASKVALNYSRELHDFFLIRLTALGFTNPEERAATCLQLFLGAIVTSQMGTVPYSLTATLNTVKYLVETK